MRNSGSNSGSKRQSITRRKAGASRQVSNAKAVKIDFSILKKAIVVTVFFLLVYAVVYMGQQLNSVVVEEVLIYGSDEKIPSHEINRLIKDEIKKSFWSLDMKVIKEEVESHAWVRNAMIKKQWPNKLVIAIDEQVPIARWDNDQLLSTTGEIIYGGSLIGYLHLPKFVANKDKLELVIGHFNRLQRVLRKNQLAVTTLELSSSGQWSFELNEDVLIKVGDEISDEKINRLVKVVEKELVSDMHKVQKIDLRYPNGLSVSWRNDESNNVYAMNR